MLPAYSMPVVALTPYRATLSDLRAVAAGVTAFDPTTDPLAACFIDGLCEASLFDDGSDSYTGVLNDAPAPTTGSWRIQSVTDRVGGYVFSAPTTAERVTWNHTTKRFEGDGNRRLVRSGAGTPQDILSTGSFAIFMDVKVTSGSDTKNWWDFGDHSGVGLNQLVFLSSVNMLYDLNSSSGRLTDTTLMVDTRYLYECYYVTGSKRFLRDDTLIDSNSTPASYTSPDDTGIAIFGQVNSASGMVGSSAGIWIFDGGVTTDFEAQFRAWVSANFL